MIQNNFIIQLQYCIIYSNQAIAFACFISHVVGIEWYQKSLLSGRNAYKLTSMTSSQQKVETGYRNINYFHKLQCIYNSQ